MSEIIFMRGTKMTVEDYIVFCKNLIGILEKRDDSEDENIKKIIGSLKEIFEEAEKKTKIQIEISKNIPGDGSDIGFIPDKSVDIITYRHLSLAVNSYCMYSYVLPKALALYDLNIEQDIPHDTRFRKKDICCSIGKCITDKDQQYCGLDVNQIQTTIKFDDYKIIESLKTIGICSEGMIYYILKSIGLSLSGLYTYIYYRKAEKKSELPRRECFYRNKKKKNIAPPPYTLSCCVYP